MTDGPDEALVLDRVQRCLEGVVGGSGHLASYRLDPATFAVTERIPLEDGLVAYDFTVVGGRISEFEAAEPSSAAPDQDEPLSGRIVLDGDGGYVSDDEGRIRLQPWTTLLDPEREAAADDGIDALLEELDRSRE